LPSKQRLQSSQPDELDDPLIELNALSDGSKRQVRTVGLNLAVFRIKPVCTPSMTAIPMQEHRCVETVCRFAGVAKKTLKLKPDFRGRRRARRQHR